MTTKQKLQRPSVLKRFLQPFGLVFAAFGLLGALLFGAAAEIHVVIMHTNDTHGHLLPDGQTGGSARIASIARQMRPHLILDAGDLFTGTPIADVSRGRAVIDVMNAIGYDAVAVGNHEFDYGIDTLRDRIREADFPFLSANIDTPIEDIHNAAIFNVEGIRFGVIGLTTESPKTVTHPRNVTEVDVTSLVGTLEETLPGIRDLVDVIIVLSHILPEEEIRVARAFPEIDLIVGGHSHSELPEPVWEGDTMIVRTGHYGQFVGRIDIEFDDKEIEEMTGRLIPTTGVSEDARIREILGPYAADVAAEMAEVIGQAPVDLESSRGSESPLANLVADALRDGGGTEVALTNLGGIRAGIRQGPITRAKVFEVLPFDNTLVTMNLEGRVLKRILGKEVLAVSGIRVQLDLERPPGERLLSVELTGGVPIRDETLYSITTNDFLLAGGDGLDEFGEGADIYDTGLLMRDALSQYISGIEAVPVRPDGRMRTQR